MRCDGQVGWLDALQHYRLRGSSGLVGMGDRRIERVNAIIVAVPFVPCIFLPRDEMVTVHCSSMTPNCTE